jgi:S-adenosylmethionine hydrolase
MIALVTDFGLDDPYVGIMKAILAEISPSVPRIDITHQIPPGDVQRGAFVLWQASRDFPPGAVFLCVVDPGVGTSRKSIILETGGQIFIGPDNGLFSYLLYNREFTCRELTNPEVLRPDPSNTFHGRDQFAPAAGHAARGIPFSNFGPLVKSLEKIPEPILILKEGSLRGEILSQDRFGNLFTSLGEFRVKENALLLHSWIDNTEIIINTSSQIYIQALDNPLPFIPTFGAVDPGKCAGLIGSTGLLEIIANQSSAADLLALKRGDTVDLVWTAA